MQGICHSLALYTGRVLITTVDRLLHHHGVNPKTKFKASTFQRAEHAKPKAFMMFDGGDVIAIPDAGDHLAHRRTLCPFDQGLE